MSGRDEVDAVKRALTNIPAVLEALGLTQGSKRNARGVLILCPGHSERDPSCGVTLGESGTIRLHCFSACGFTGDIFALIAARYQLVLPADFQEVLAIGADMAGITLPERPRSPGGGSGGGSGKDAPVRALRLLPPVAPAEPPPPPRPVATLTEEIHLGRALDLLADRYPVASDGGVAAGLDERGLLEEATKERWAVLPKGWRPELFEEGSLLPLHPLLTRMPPKPAADPFESHVGHRTMPLYQDHRLVIPWRRPDGRAWSFQRRFSPRSGNEDTKALGAGAGGKHIPKFVWPSALVYVPREHFPFGVDAFEAYEHSTEECWWTEGASDALSLRVLNQQGRLSKTGRARAMVAVGLPGVQTLDVYLKALGPLVRGRRGFVGVDADKAGQSVAQPWRAAQIALGAVESTITTPPEKDWNAFLRAGRAAAR